MIPPVLFQDQSADLPDRVSRQVEALGENIAALAEEQAELAQLVGVEAGEHVTRMGVFQGYMGVIVAAFLVTLIATPIMRRLALANGIVDHPGDARKVHRKPIPYLGGVAVYLGIMAGVFFSYVAMRVTGLIDFHPVGEENRTFGVDIAFVPPSIVLGITVIMLVGLLDDVFGVHPWRKIGGQLFAAAALAYENIGVQIAKGVLAPIGQAFFDNPDMVWMLPGTDIPIDIIYWTGTAIIAVFVLGGTNAANLIDGLDGLLTGVTAVASMGLLVIALTLAVEDDGPRDAQRLVLCMALLGACLGFLPYNFNPANIFLGDCGSLLLGFTTIVVILSLGDTGKTHLVAAGLFIYGIPIIDTALAIVRRKLAGKSIAEADNQHLHHMLKNSLNVKGAVLVLYGIGSIFALLGVAMSLGRARISYAVALLFASYVGVTAIKIARKQYLEQAEEAARAAIKHPPPRVTTTEAGESKPAKAEPVKPA